MSRPRRPLLSGRRRDANPEASWINAARDAFRIIDVNGDGYLQKEEVIRAISTMQDENSDVDFADGGDPAEMAHKMMAEVDTDGDGQIDMDEFVEMMRKGQQQATANGNGGRAAGVGGLSMSYNHRMSQLARNVLLAHQKKIENSVIGDDLWMIHPMSNVHAIWDVLVSLLILLTVITMPLSIGWDDLNDAFFAMNLTVDFIFLLDVCKNFCTGFIDENDAVIMDAKVVRRNYLMGFFITDLCSSLPLDLILRAAGASDAGGAVTGTKQSLKMLKLLRMAKLFRLLRISRLFKHIKELLLYLEERLNFRISDGFTKLLRLGIGAIVLGHWIGCFNFMLVRLHNFPEDSWVVYAGLDDKDAYTQWSWSFFKALAQMIMIGFETPPFTNASCDTASHWCGIEHWITLMCLYIGAVFYSLLISSISAVLQTASLASRQFEEKLTVIDDYMRSKKLPAAMREKVKDYFHLQHANGKLYNETEILDMVTPILRREIKQFNGRDITNKVPIFKSVANKDFAEEMTNAIEPTIAFNNEVIMRENTTGDEMYFINSGVVEIFVAGAKNSAYVAIGDGCVSGAEGSIGELPIYSRKFCPPSLFSIILLATRPQHIHTTHKTQYFGEVSLLLGVRRTASARTKTQCMLYKISRARLLDVLQDFPEMAERMRKTAEGRVRRLEYYLDPTNKTLSKEDEVDPEDSKTDLFGADADVVARDKAEAFDEQRRERYRGAPGVHGGPAAGGIRASGLYSPVRRKAHQGGGGGNDGSRGGGGLIRRNNFNARTVLPLTSTARRNDHGEMA